MIDRTTYDILQRRYHVYEIETSIGYSGAFDENEVTINLSGFGFTQLVKDLFNPQNCTNGLEKMFSISTIPIKEDNVVYVAKYATDEYPIDVIVEYGKKLREVFEANGHKLILMPKIIDVSALGVEQIIKIRDGLTELIDSLSYDNIIGF